MSCSFLNENSPCGVAPGQNNPTIVPVKSCDHDLDSHLASLGISGRARDDQTSQISEADVILNRAGFLHPVENRWMNLLCAPDMDTS